MTDPDRPRILSVEDNPETRMLLKHLLGETYEVHFAHNAEEGLQAIKDKVFDVLLLDIHLGDDVGGTRLLHRVREEKEAEGAPAIAVTAYAMPGDRKKLLQEGFNEYVGKPFTGDDLKEVIGRVLSNE